MPLLLIKNIKNNINPKINVKNVERDAVRNIANDWSNINKIDNILLIFFFVVNIKIAKKGIFWRIILSNTQLFIKYYPIDPVTKKQVKTEHFILDPSFFTSVKRLSEARQVLDDIFNDDNIVIKKPKVVLVSGLRSISNRDTRMDSKELRDVLVGWGMSQKK